VGRQEEVAVADEPEVAVGRAREDADPARELAERLHDPARVLALSDGVFAIIITLLVLEVHVPELSQGQSLNQALAEIRPSLTAFVISFILAGMYWVAHRDLFALIRRTDRGLVWLNILYLLPLCLLPFGAGMLGRYDQEPVALRIYAAAGPDRAHAGGHLAVCHQPPAPAVAASGRPPAPGRAGHQPVPGLIYLLAFLVARRAPEVRLTIYAGVPLLYFLSITVLRGSRRRDREYADFT
jgi:hypothetical protein